MAPIHVVDLDAEFLVAHRLHRAELCLSTLLVSLEMNGERCRALAEHDHFQPVDFFLGLLDAHLPRP